MANLITEFDIKKFQGMEKAILPAGTILTPAAQDWANEHNLEVSFGDGVNHENISTKVDDQEKRALLKEVVAAVIKKLQQSGTPVKKEELVPLVIACLERLGCQVK